MKYRLRISVLLLSLYCGCQVFAQAEMTALAIKWDMFKVEGLGWKTNRQLERALKVMVNNETETILLNQTTLEDAFMVLDHEVKRLGYLQPAFSCKIMPIKGPSMEVDWQAGVDIDTSMDDVTVPLQALTFQVVPGKLYYYATISVHGTPFLSEQEVISFFHPVGQWIVSKRDRYYTPARLSQSVQHLLNVLKEAGYRQATVAHQTSAVDEATGAVAVEVVFEPGLLHFIESISLETEGTTPPEHPFVPSLVESTLFSPSWLGHYLYAVRRHYQAQGYVDVEVGPFTKILRTSETHVALQLILRVKPGMQKWVGQITFAGADMYHAEFFQRQVKLRSGEQFDLAKVEQARTNLQRLRQFKAVDVEFTDAASQTRDVVFKLTPLPRDSITLIGGIGSYDIVRAGVQWKRLHLWGLAHRAELELLQSLRMSQVDYRYTIPQLWGTHVNCFATAYGLFREEISFDREEWGVSVGATYPWQPYNTHFTAQFNYESLAVQDQDFLPEDGLEEATVSSFELRVRKHELDHPIYPETGYQLFAAMEFALPAIGGDVDYQQLELGGTYHQRLVDGLTGRLGLQHGLLTSFGSSATNIPFNRRFFLGGENTVRGYRSGEASPLDADGKEIGAAAYTLVQFELEQKLNQSFSLVAFFDAAGLCEEIEDYGSPEWLHSVGAGVRIRTFLGPLRCEYAHNVNPRAADPRGSFQVGLGMPF